MASDFYEARKQTKLLSLSHISPGTQNYLCKVYLYLFCSFLIAVAGIYAQVLIIDSQTTPGTFVLLGIPIIAMIIGLICYLVLVFTNIRRTMLRFSMWLIFSFCEGVSISLIFYVMRHDFVKIIYAFGITCAIFLALSGCALLTKRRTFLFLGTFLVIALFGVLIASIFLIVFHSSIFELVLLIITLIIFMLLVLYETQMIIEMSEQGYRDELLNSAVLLIDFLAIFVRILALLGHNDRQRY